MTRKLAGILLFFSASAAMSQTTPVADIVKTPPSWSDDFTNGLNANDWDRGLSPWPNTIANRILWGTGERQIYVDKAYLGTETLATQAEVNTGGTAILKAMRMDAGTKSRVNAKVTAENPPENVRKAIQNADWMSAVLKGSAKRDSTFQYGYIEASIRWEPTAESWPAFWMLPAKWAGTPEIDIVEMKMEKGVPTAVMGIHSDQAGWVNNGCRVPIPNNGLGYHRYGFHWNATSTKATFYLDGAVSCVMDVPSDLNQSFYPILNLAMGGWGATPTSDTKEPQVMQVDYIRIWKNY